MANIAETPMPMGNLADTSMSPAGPPKTQPKHKGVGKKMVKDGVQRQKGKCSSSPTLSTSKAMDESIVSFGKGDTSAALVNQFTNSMIQLQELHFA